MIEIGIISSVASHVYESPRIVSCGAVRHSQYHEAIISSDACKFEHLLTGLVFPFEMKDVPQYNTLSKKVITVNMKRTAYPPENDKNILNIKLIIVPHCHFGIVPHCSHECSAAILLLERQHEQTKFVTFACSSDE